MKTIGVDIGGTSIRSILYEDGRILKEFQTSSAGETEKLVESILLAITEVDDGAEAIGIGCSGFANDDGVFVFSPNLPLEGVNLKQRIEDQIQLPVSLENDANMFALAEYEQGAGKDSRTMIGLIIGTGIGAGIILDGEVYRGATGGAGEVGHMIVDTPKEGHTGHWEHLASGRGIERRYEQMAGKKLSVQDIWHEESDEAKTVIDETYRYLSIGIANLVNILNPDRIVLGGGVSDALDPERLLKGVNDFAISPSTKELRIVKNQLGNDAGRIGAALLPLVT